MTEQNGIVYEGGDGSSEEKAIIITGAANGLEGVFAESDFIHAKHPDWRKVRQALIQRFDVAKIYDRVIYETLEGEQHTFYFDITAFYGK